jgi:hypothetical protein
MSEAFQERRPRGSTAVDDKLPATGKSRLEGVGAG